MPSPNLRPGWHSVKSSASLLRAVSPGRWHDAVVDLGTFAHLLTPPGQALVGQAVQAYAEAGGDPVRAGDLLRRGSGEVDPALAAAAMSQAALRARARGKFGADSERMWFTLEGLEQATRTQVADHRAARLARWLAASRAGR